MGQEVRNKTSKGYRLFNTKTGRVSTMCMRNVYTMKKDIKIDNLHLNEQENLDKKTCFRCNKIKLSQFRTQLRRTALF